MTDQQQKMEVNISGVWYPLIAMHERGDEKVAVFEQGDGLYSQWVGANSYLQTRPAPEGVDDEGHVPTPHEPVKGVTLWNTTEQQDLPDICVDDRNRVGYLAIDGNPVLGSSTCGRHPLPNTKAVEVNAPALRAFRDHIRAERKAKVEAAKVDALDDLIKRCDQWNGHHRTVTFADVAALARIVRDMRKEGK